MELSSGCKVKKAENHKPHVHCIYGNDEIIIALDGEILEGDIPKRKLKLVEAWLTLHEDELYANWKLLSDGDGYFKVEPLR